MVSARWLTGDNRQQSDTNMRQKNDGIVLENVELTLALAGRQVPLTNWFTLEVGESAIFGMGLEG